LHQGRSAESHHVSAVERGSVGLKKRKLKENGLSSTSKYIQFGALSRSLSQSAGVNAIYNSVAYTASGLKDPNQIRRNFVEVLKHTQSANNRKRDKQAEMALRHSESPQALREIHDIIIRQNQRSQKNAAEKPQGIIKMHNSLAPSGATHEAIKTRKLKVKKDFN